MKRLPPRLQAALDRAGAILKREKKHLIFSLPSGQQVTIPNTPSDSRWEENALADLRRALGQAGGRQVVVGHRRIRRRKPGRAGPLVAPLGEVAGLKERALQARIRELEMEVQALRGRLASLQARWYVRLAFRLGGRW